MPNNCNGKDMNPYVDVGQLCEDGKHWGTPAKVASKEIILAVDLEIVCSICSFRRWHFLHS